MANMRDLLKILRSNRRDLTETIKFEGILRICELPEDFTPEQYAYWWLPEKDSEDHVIRPARITEREKERMTVVESHNQLMTAGRNLILSFIGSPSGNSTAFGKYLALGTGALQATSPSDTTLVNEVYRVTQTSNTVQGSQIDVNFQIPSASAQVTMSEAGLYGGAASGTFNSGTLVTHVLFSYTKGNYPIAADYLVNLL